MLEGGIRHVATTNPAEPHVALNGRQDRHISLGRLTSAGSQGPPWPVGQSSRPGSWCPCPTGLCASSRPAHAQSMQGDRPTASGGQRPGRTSSLSNSGRHLPVPSTGKQNRRGDVAGHSRALRTGQGLASRAVLPSAPGHPAHGCCLPSVLIQSIRVPRPSGTLLGCAHANAAPRAPQLGVPGACDSPVGAATLPDCSLLPWCPGEVAEAGSGADGQRDGRSPQSSLCPMLGELAWLGPHPRRPSTLPDGPRVLTCRQPAPVTCSAYLAVSPTAQLHHPRERLSAFWPRGWAQWGIWASRKSRALLPSRTGLGRQHRSHQRGFREGKGGQASGCGF